MSNVKVELTRDELDPVASKTPSARTPVLSAHEDPINAYAESAPALTSSPYPINVTLWGRLESTLFGENVSADLM